jgi:large subunit ribosomal protein L7e
VAFLLYITECIKIMIGMKINQLLTSFIAQEKELVQLKREARMKGGFYVEPEAKLLFVIRIRGWVTVS